MVIGPKSMRLKPRAQEVLSQAHATRAGAGKCFFGGAGARYGLKADTIRPKRPSFKSFPLSLSYFTGTHMKKKEIKAKVHALLAIGTPKTEVFEQFSGQGATDRQLAFSIASYADPNKRLIHQRKVNILIGIMFIQAILAFFVGAEIGAKSGPKAIWAVGALLMLIPLLFALGFYKGWVGAYNAYILLTSMDLPRSLQGFSTRPIATTIGFIIGVALLAYVWYVRRQLFPDFAFFGPKKLKGKYVFSD